MMRKSQRKCLYWVSNRLTCGEPHDEGPAPLTPVLLPASLDTSLLHALKDLASNRAVSSASLGLMSSSAMDPATKNLASRKGVLARISRRYRRDPHKQHSRGEKKSGRQYWRGRRGRSCMPQPCSPPQCWGSEMRSKPVTPQLHPGT